ncbi:hypothetical protein A0H81_13136 [Grifola frondosa]|uniref:ARID domain-containing protein n=1 Tax=Grifola frondosa TaxID=5627 RepID=A0A1C7LQ45_GRIFR|nr:hypothetical protein A0H81_13136 [Grifola frondosa]
MNEMDMNIAKHADDDIFVNQRQQQRQQRPAVTYDSLRHAAIALQSTIQNLEERYSILPSDCTKMSEGIGPVAQLTQLGRLHDELDDLHDEISHKKWLLNVYHQKLNQMVAARTGASTMNSNAAAYQARPGLMPIRPLSHDMFQSIFEAFSLRNGCKPDPEMLQYRDQPISLYNLHFEVVSGGGFDRVIENNQWLLICTELGFLRSPAVQHLQRVYKEYLMQFDNAYIWAISRLQQIQNQ